LRSDLREVDVLVVGAGPAGLSTAHALAAAGYSTLVVERQPTVGERVRTSGVTALSTVVRLACPTALCHELRRIRFATSSDDVTVDCQVRPLCVLDVRGFYRWLADRAEAVGAQILTDASVTGVRTSGDAVVGCSYAAHGNVTEVSARVVVDASGYRATVSRDARLHGGFHRFGVGAEYELTAPYVNQDDAVIVLSERFAPSGYGWLFPWGANRARLGVGLHHADVRSDPREAVRELCSSAASFGLDLRSSSVEEYHFGLVPAGGTPRQIAADGLVAVGDAAGQATLVVGEGIRIAIIAGEFAAETIGAALEHGDVSRERLLPYQERFRREFERELRVGEMVNRRLARFGDNEWNASLQLLRSMPSSLVLDILESRFSRRQLLRWLARNPRTAIRSRTLWQAALTR
jgi:digeranylgeranylglycerophospholipid reductase